ncbi:AraC family transcriptional regulator [uncultured Kordia sp.]|uniref:helix-turn-helix domain-containing protein n=1 Tax=uncultured Kordia sp. TaxID=507699 RepID=UPI0026356640|nr:helix-turn-helix domain-containing protein [uncultured Kordia sp.]
MSTDTEFYDGFMSALLLIAFAHGVVLASLLFFNKRLNAKANRFLALSLLGVSLLLFYEFISYIGLQEEVTELIQLIPIYLSSAIPIGLYFFVTYLIHPKHTLKSWEKWWILPLLLQAFLSLLYIPLEEFYTSKIAAIALEILPFAEEFVGLVTSLFLLPITIYKVRNYQKFITFNYSTIDRKSLSWLFNFLVVFAVLLLLWWISCMRWLFGYSYESTYIYVIIGMVILLFSIGYFVIQQYHLFEIIPFSSKKISKEKNQKKLSVKTDTYYTELLKLIEEKRLYENVELTLDDLTKELQLSSGYLSQIINKKEKKSFFEFINFYRVEAVKKKLLDHNYAHYDILSIALESGFKSKSTFNAVFKKMTKQTPSAYKKKHL